MILWLLNLLTKSEAAQGVLWRRIAFRTGAAALVAFLLAVVFGPAVIRWLRRHFREPIVSPSPTIKQLHQHKEWTPTMGGLFIVAGIAAALALVGDWDTPFLAPALMLLLGLAAIGAWDDLKKLRQGRGLGAWAKLMAQAPVAAAAATWLYCLHPGCPDVLDLTVVGLGTVHLGIWFIPLAVLVIVGSSNAVNLTDGLDGLAGGCLLLPMAAMGILAYVAGHALLADYLGVVKVGGAGEMSVVAGATIGAVLGFLWFNCHPAQVFMGDTGSLPLGGLLGFLAVVARQELLLIVIGGVFVVEAASVLLQVGYYKWRRRRLLLCAPLHHHFQFLGWPESRIVVRFWIAATLCSVLGLAGLKLSSRERSHRLSGDVVVVERLTQQQADKQETGREK